MQREATNNPQKLQSSKAKCDVRSANDACNSRPRRADEHPQDLQAALSPIRVVRIGPQQALDLALRWPLCGLAVRQAKHHLKAFLARRFVQACVERGDRR